MTTKSSEEIEREVEATRGDLDRTVEALKDKMTPSQLFDEATRAMGGASNQILTKTMEQARQNPLPIALIGLGVAWLAMSQKKQTVGAASYVGSYEGRALKGDRYETYEGYQTGGGQGLKARVSDVVDSAKQKLSGAKDKITSATSHAKSGATDAASSGASRISAMTSGASQRASQYRRQAETKFQDTLDSEPLMLAAIGVAVGAAIGASIPPSRMENRYIGPARDKLVGRGKDMASSSLEDAKSVAQRAYGQVKEELHRQTGPEGEGSTLKEKAQSIAKAGAQTVQDEVHGRMPH